MQTVCEREQKCARARFRGVLRGVAALPFLYGFALLVARGLESLASAAP